MGRAFRKVYQFHEKLGPFLHSIWENNQLGPFRTDEEARQTDFEPVTPFQYLEDPRLKGATTIMPLLIERFKT